MPVIDRESFIQWNMKESRWIIKGADRKGEKALRLGYGRRPFNSASHFTAHPFPPFLFDSSSYFHPPPLCGIINVHKKKPTNSVCGWLVCFDSPTVRFGMCVLFLFYVAYGCDDRHFPLRELDASTSCNGVSNKRKVTIISRTLASILMDTADK